MSNKKEKKDWMIPMDFEKSPEVMNVDGVNCFSIRIMNEYVRKFIGFKSIEEDLKICLSCIEYLKKNQESNSGTETIACTYTLISCYGRCFASAKERTAGLSLHQVPEKYRKRHKLIIDYRNLYVAHSSGMGEMSAAFLALNPNHSKKRLVGVSPPLYSRLSGLGLSLDAETEELVKVLLVDVEDKIKIHYSRLADWAAKQDLNALYSLFDSALTKDESISIELAKAYIWKYSLEQGTGNIRIEASSATD